MTAALRKPFLSLGVPNYRRYFTGQVVSLSGNWVQIVAETWLILRLTHSGVAVGLLAALQFAPMLLLGAYGGLLADRFDKRKLLMLTQLGMVVPALTLFARDGHRRGGALDGVRAGAGPRHLERAGQPRPAELRDRDGRPRQGGQRGLLNSVIVHCARMVGPAIAGVLIATVGVEPCFLINAVSFMAMLVALRRMDAAALTRPEPAPRRPRALREGLAYVAAHAGAGGAAGDDGAGGHAGVQLPGDPAAAGQVHVRGRRRHLRRARGGDGRRLGGRRTHGGRPRARVPGAAGGRERGVRPGDVLAAVAPTFPLTVAALTLMGAASVTFAAGVNSTLQLEVAPEMRGRVMALYSVVFLGSTPIGGPLAGWVAQAANPRAALMLGAVAALAAAVGAAVFARRHGGRARPVVLSQVFSRP